MSLKLDEGASGTTTITIPVRGEDIPAAGVPVTAFIGPAPRGPVDRAVAINDPAEFDKLFGVPNCHCRLEAALRQFFLNGGVNAVVVRITGSRIRNRIVLPCDQGTLQLEARNPGPLEFIRASVDYDGLRSDDVYSFNLVVQRLRSDDSAWIGEQEYFRGVNIDSSSRDYVGRVLEQSALLRLTGSPPVARPQPTIKSGSVREAGYVTAVPFGPDRGELPSDYDLIGSPADGTGLAALGGIDDLGQLCLLSGSPDGAIGPVALLAAERFCRQRQAVLLIDPPTRWESVPQVLDELRGSGFSSPVTVTWFPGVSQRDAAGERLPTTATGAIAAALQQGLRTHSIACLPESQMTMQRAGLQLNAELSSDEVQRLARVGVNGLVRRSALHMQLQGDVTQERQTGLGHGCDRLTARSELLFILRRLRLGTRWVRRYRSAPPLWREVKEQVERFLAALHDQGMLSTCADAPAYRVQCDEASNAGRADRLGDVTVHLQFTLPGVDGRIEVWLRQSPDGCDLRTGLSRLSSAQAISA